MTYKPPGAGHYREPRREIHPVAYALRRRRYELNISQPGLAEEIGYSPRMMERWERGENLPRLDVLTAWANALGATLKVEFGDER
jgi:transcriptional regulator with XRE-family HTH domain